MSKRGCLLLVLVASTQVAQAQTDAHRPELDGRMQSDSTPSPLSVPTVVIPQATPGAVPTVVIPAPTATPSPTPRPTPRPTAARTHRTARKPPARVRRASQQWIWAYLTSYCPGSAGWISSSGLPVFYGMLANNFYRFGTHVYIPVMGMTGVVEDRTAGPMWNHFDVWSPTCYGTPTGWFKVAVQLD